MARVNYEKQQAIRDIVYTAMERIIKEDREAFNKTTDGKQVVKLNKQIDKLEAQIKDYRNAINVLLPKDKAGRYDKDNVTTEGMARLEKLEALHKEFAVAITFASSGKEYEAIQAFMKAVKAL